MPNTISVVDLKDDMGKTAKPCCLLQRIPYRAEGFIKLIGLMILGGEALHLIVLLCPVTISDAIRKYSYVGVLKEIKSQDRHNKKWWPSPRKKVSSRRLPSNKVL